MSYDVPQGDKRGSEVDLFDFTYDGILNDNYLSGGLGQLTDGDEGNSNFRTETRELKIKGYEWIGWKNDTQGSKPIEIMFKFDSLRNFSMVKIHSNNFYDKDVRVFRRADVYFSVGGRFFTGPPIRFMYQRDTFMESDRDVEIHLQHNVGRYVKILLYFDAKWMMISEVKFSSGNCMIILH